MWPPPPPPPLFFFSLMIVYVSTSTISQQAEYYSTSHVIPRTWKSIIFFFVGGERTTWCYSNILRTITALILWPARDLFSSWTAFPRPWSRIYLLTSTGLPARKSLDFFSHHVTRNELTAMKYRSLRTRHSCVPWDRNDVTWNSETRTIFENFVWNLKMYTPNANMADHSIGAWDELHESEASQASVFVLTMLSYKSLAYSSIWCVSFRCSYELLCFWMPREVIEVFTVCL